MWLVVGFDGKEWHLTVIGKGEPSFRTVSCHKSSPNQVLSTYIDINFKKECFRSTLGLVLFNLLLFFKTS